MRETLTPNGHPEEDAGGAAEQPDWKIKVEKAFRRWLEEVEHRQPAGPAPEEPPDLYSFFEELAALRSEVRKGARRSHDTFSRFGDALGGFEQTLQGLSARLNEDRAAREEADLAARRALYLPLVELFERFRRMEQRMARPPRRRLLGAKPWREAWSDVQEGLEILGAHFEALLHQEGITAVETEGRPFDPALMTAVEAREAPEAEPDTVVEELSRGYLHRGRVLKLAQVVVARSKGGTA